MKKLSLLVLFVLSTLSVYAQVIETFDAAAADTTYQFIIEAAPSTIVASQSSDFKEGTSALQLKASVGALHNWGSFAQAIKRLPDDVPAMDWTINDTLSIWIKVVDGPKHPANMVFRVHIADRPTPTDNIEEYIYENVSVLDYANDWYQLKIPLVERVTDGGTTPDSTGFVLFPTSWGGGSYNNSKLDLNKIVGFNLGLITTGWDPNANLPADSLTVIFDLFERSGVKAIPVVIFNGKTFPTDVTSNLFSWGQSSIEVVENAGIVAKSNAAKWTQGNEWNNGWTGIGGDMVLTNMAGSWQKDTLQITLKAEEGVGALRFQFESATGNGIRGSVFTPTTDNQWHTYRLALKDMTTQDNKPDFDSSQINKWGLMAEGTGVAGKVVWFTDTWTGNPVFDVISPDQAQNVLATAGTMQNLVSWTDVPNETGETYNVYYYHMPITEENLAYAEVVKANVLENIQLVEHKLLAPATDQNVSYYYAVVCRDAAGNYGLVSVNSPLTTNLAKGVVTFTMTTPSFAADGDLSEFAALPAHELKSSNGTAFIVTNQKVDSDDDLSAVVRYAMDANNLYVAADVTDDIFNHIYGVESYKSDGFDMFVGLYNAHGLPHPKLSRGARPDYHIRFSKHKISLDGVLDSLMGTGADYALTEKFPSGYTIEARIPFALLAEKAKDAVFVPELGMRLPLDFAINDADLGEREGIMTYSPFNEDLSYQTVQRWLYTWIGTTWNPVGVEDEKTQVMSYSLSQNYPNPFNPVTRISYSLQQAGLTTIRIYDVLGREVATLLNQVQAAGNHSINFNASGLTSGIYLYKIESGSFSEVKKMALVR